MRRWHRAVEKVWNDLHVLLTYEVSATLFPLEAGPALPVKPIFVPDSTPPPGRGKTGPMLDMCAKDLCRLPLPVALNIYSTLLSSLRLQWSNNLCNHQWNYLGGTILLILKISCLGLMEGDSESQGLTCSWCLGMGVPTVTAARILKGQLSGQSGEETQLEMERFPFVSLAKVWLGYCCFFFFVLSGTMYWSM